MIRWLLSFGKRKQLAQELNVSKDKLDQVLKRLSKEMENWD